MKKTIKEIVSYLKANPTETFFILGALFMCAGAYGGASGWLMIPCVRLVLHAVAAFFISLFFNMIGLGIILIAREAIGIWITLLEVWRLITKKTRIKLRRILKSLMWAICPFVGVIAYIVKSYKWESSQAIEYGRAIQMDQLTVDIVFSIVACIIWMLCFNSWARKNYFFSPRKGTIFVMDILERVEEIVVFENHERLDDRLNLIMEQIVIIICMAIPIWVTLLMILAFKCIPVVPCWGLV